MPNLPSRFSQKAVDRYASAIATIVNRWPGPVVFDPKPYSVETFSARLRDAITAIVAYEGVHPLINVTGLRRIATQITVRIRDQNVVAGSPEATKAKFVSQPFAEPISAAKFIGELDAGRTVLVQALALLLSERIITGPFRLTNVHDQKLLAESLTSFDVALDVLDDHTTSIV